jgi:glutaredoxin-related protein
MTYGDRRRAKWTGAGVSRHVAMQITEHKTESMYRRYNIVTESDIRAALAKTQTYPDTLPATSR